MTGGEHAVVDSAKRNARVVVRVGAVLRNEPKFAEWERFAERTPKYGWATDCAELGDL